MITSIKIDGFKSFKDFSMEFTPFTLIAGTNASGKSNLFDALKLLSDLSHSDLKNAFTNQRGEAIELFTQIDTDEYVNKMLFEVEMLVDKDIKDSWGGEAILKYTRLKYKIIIERKSSSDGIDKLIIKEENLVPLRHLKDKWVQKHISKTYLNHWRPKVKTGKRGKPYIYTELRNSVPTIKLPQDGKPGGKETPASAVSRTVLSGIDDVNFPHAFAAREEMRRWNFLQLNPDDLRMPTKKEIGMSDTITHSGKNLASTLYRLYSKDKFVLKDISRKLNNLLPNLIDVKVIDDTANNQYLIKLTSSDGKDFSSRVLSEGTLRLLTLCIFLFDNKHKSLLCYEEPENGIHPFRIKFLAELLIELGVNFSDTEFPLRQILVNTHSPKLVGELKKFENNSSVSMWFSRLNTLIADVNGKKRKLGITKILPVQKENNPDLFTSLNINEAEKKITISQVKKYLESIDFSENQTSL